MTRGAALLLLLLALAMPGTGRAAPAEFDLTTADGRQRHYLLDVPRAPAGGPLPLVIVLHGTYGTGEKMARHLGFGAYVERMGIAVAYPDAYREPGRRQTLRWNDGRGTLASSEAGIDDVAFMRALVDDIARRVPLDRRRVFVTGASNGGMMAWRVGCEAADLVAAIAPVIGAVPKPIAGACRPSRPISVLAVNGVEDPIVPFAGGLVCAHVAKVFCERGEVIAAPDSLARFAAAAGCAATPRDTPLPATVDDGTRVRRSDYGGCAGGVRLRGLWIEGGGHAWPPLSSQLGERKSGRSSGNLNATEAILRFFLDL
ncbi:dienelactone hydrolase family protein [Zavarzinia compransoris]|uniref:alpha/beta hydrolase family esterase n=1 Tax=Zavarzinia marina TaxID=2911065 RepID=UPI001F282FB7|nr:PHB depolymerase family esterase [Zavarzinia marina]MCF4166039.1 dienelactone hydrolase family protein [Zavarzinia marina]